MIVSLSSFHSLFLRIVPLCLLSIAIGCAIRGTGGGPVDVPDDDNGQSGPAGSSNGFDNSAHILLTTLLVDNAGGATENTCLLYTSDAADE